MQDIRSESTGFHFQSINYAPRSVMDAAIGRAPVQSCDVNYE